MAGLHFWATGYWVSTVGRDEPPCDGTYGSKKIEIVSKGNCSTNTNQVPTGFPCVFAPLCGAGQSHALRAWSITV